MYEVITVELRRDGYDLIREALDLYTHDLQANRENEKARKVMRLVWEQFYHPFDTLLRHKNAE